MHECKIAVIGATGAVGRVFLSILEERNFPAASIRLCGKSSVGSKLNVMGENITVEEVTPKLLSEVDLAFISATTSVSKEIAPLAAAQGAVVIDDSSAFRMDAKVPLIVPEVNVEALETHQGIISIPNCSTTPLVMLLKPLDRVNPIQRVIADTYQSVSGTGTAAVKEMKTQSLDVLQNRPVKTDVYPHQIAFNLIPHIDHFHDNGYSNEEMKMILETRKIMKKPDLKVSATCVRVPVSIGHSESVHIGLSNHMSVTEVRSILEYAPGIKVLDDPNSSVYPMPIHAEGKDDVYVGRIREDVSDENSITAWIVSDNLRKGAGLNAIQIAEELLVRDLIHR